MIAHPNLKLWLRFDQLGADDSGNNHIITWVGETSYVDGISGNALRCTKGGSQITPSTGFGYATVSGSDLMPLSVMTACCWARLRASNGVGNSAICMLSDYDGDVSYDLALNETSARFYLNNATKSYQLATIIEAFSLNTFYHLAGVSDGVSNKLYINGLLKASVVRTNSDAIYTAGFPVGVAAVQVPGTLFRSASLDIDDLQFYNGIALPASDIKRIMQGLHPLTRS